MSNPKSPRRYSAEFKRNTAELYLSGDKSIRELGSDLGLAESTLHKWVSQYREHGAKSFEPKELTPQEKEVVALKKQLADITMERDILKKAIAIFSRKR